MLEIEIDGKQTQVPAGSTIMDAAQKVGAYIPHFCYHKKLSISANCRMCLVQVEKAPKPLPACATPVTNGMKVFTHSELAVNAQKGVMEFLLINHPLDCPICDQGGECQLQDLAVGYGGTSSRYQESKRVVFHKNVGPLISMQEMSRCIHCTRCVRFGQEIAGVMELGMANRNMHSEIQTFVGRTVDSELSGNMIDLCPVGALTSKPFRYTARSWELSRRRSISPHDSLGSNLTVQVKNNRVMRVLPRENEDVNECWISDRDRFSYEALNSDERLTKPMVRVDGALREVDWNVALDYVSHALKDVVKTHGAEQIASLASPGSTLEELYLLQKLTRSIGSGNVDFRPRRKDFSADSQRIGLPWLGVKLSEIKDLDSVLVVGSFLRKDHPLFAQRLRQLAKKSGQVSLISVSTDDPKIALHEQITVSPQNLVLAMAKVLKAAAELKNASPIPGLENVQSDAASIRVAESLLSGAKKAIFLGNVAEQSDCASILSQLGQELSKLTGATFGFIGEAANSVGGYVANAVPSDLNAYQMFEQPRKAYMLFGLEPDLDCYNPNMAVSALKQADIVVMMSAYKSASMMEYADVLLPITPFTETSGTFINTEGRVQAVTGVCPARGESRPGWKVLRVLANLLDQSGFEYESSECIRTELLGSVGVNGDEFVSGLSNELKPLPIKIDSVPSYVQRIADVPIYFSDPTVRRAKSLMQTCDAANPQVRLSSSTLEILGLSGVLQLRLAQGSGAANLMVKVDETIPSSCVCVSAGHISTSGLGDMFGMINVERA